MLVTLWWFAPTGQYKVTLHCAAQEQAFLWRRSYRDYSSARFLPRGSSHLCSSTTAGVEGGNTGNTSSYLQVKAGNKWGGYTHWIHWIHILETPARICRLDLETSELRNLPIGEGEGLWGWMIIAIAIITAICQIWVSCILWGLGGIKPLNVRPDQLDQLASILIIMLNIKENNPWNKRWMISSYIQIFK